MIQKYPAALAGDRPGGKKIKMQQNQLNTNNELPKASTATIRLEGIVHEENKLFVFFTDGTRDWRIDCKASQLQDFKKFQAHIADRLGLWIDHDSQSAQRAHTRSADWDVAVTDAFARGAAV